MMKVQPAGSVQLTPQGKSTAKLPKSTPVAVTPPTTPPATIPATKPAGSVVNVVNNYNLTINVNEQSAARGNRRHHRPYGFSHEWGRLERELKRAEVIGSFLDLMG